MSNDSLKGSTLPRYHIGIDTGGTFTDGVLFDPLRREVVRSLKVLTTHYDLTRCIAQALDGLLPGEPGSVGLVSLSTTLSTNAIAEDKRGPVGLLLLGYDPELIKRFQFGRQFSTSAYAFIDGVHDMSGMEQIPLDEATVRQATSELSERAEALAVVSYSAPFNADHEGRAAELAMQSAPGLPVVQGHHLSSQLNSIWRASTAALNASLLGEASRFLEAILVCLRERKIDSPVAIVRGDGSLAKADFVRHRPIEIIHSGPATSAIGGKFLAGVERALVIDMGGTTTDMAVVQGDKMEVIENGSTVGNYRTCIRTIRSHSFGLGGDSLIRFDPWRRLDVGPERVLPLALFCYEFPELRGDVLSRCEPGNRVRYEDSLEYWVLRRSPRHAPEDERTREMLRLLEKGPAHMRSLLKGLGVRSPRLIGAGELVSQGVIERVGLTPTDILHVTGEFTAWDGVAARGAVQAAARLWDEGADDFARRVKAVITRVMAAEIVQFQSSRSLSAIGARHGEELDRWLFNESLEPDHPVLGCQLRLKMPIVGIGAPAPAFLPAVAEAFDTELILPSHYAVANAVGAVVGNVAARREGEVAPSLTGSVIGGYAARLDGRQRIFSSYEEAIAFCAEEAARLAEQEARDAGAQATQVEVRAEQIWDGMGHVTAWAVGKL